MSPVVELQQVFRPILASLDVAPEKTEEYVSLIKATPNPEFGDYQANLAMPLAKVLRKNPKELAAQIVAKIPLGSIVASAEVAGPGFINLRLSEAWLTGELHRTAADPRLGVAVAEPARTIVIDYSGPNVAKPLHVGHLRSTIIGESLCRLLRHLGHRVIGDNHLGDWGTQFGMLLYGYKNFLDRQAYATDPVGELARLYVHIRNLTKQLEDDEGNPRELTPEQQTVLTACRLETAKLHQGDSENLAIWMEFMPACQEEIDAIYRRLDVHFDTQLGESHFQPQLANVVASLKEKGLAYDSRGAVVVGDPKKPALVQKSDGAFTYMTTDLATIQHRVETYHPQTILYVVDFRQADHFKQLFETARAWKYADVELVHVQFGSVLGPDGKPLKTRDGKVVTLESLLDDAVAMGAAKLEESRERRESLGAEAVELSDAEKRAVAESVGIGAVKYADLSQNRTSNYTYLPDKMLATDGNTATYMQYAYARCRSIIRKAGEDESRLRTDPPPIVIAEPEERAVVLQLLKFPDAVSAAAAEYMPHHLISYMWDLAKSLSSFVASDRCNVLKAATPELRNSRLLLCDLCARVIQTILGIIGIQTLERI